MALVLCTGFEHGVNNTTSLVKGNAGNKFADSLNGTPTITSSTPRTGGFCLEVSAAAAAEHIGWDANSLGSAASVMVVGFGIYFPTAIPTANVVVHRIITSSATIDFEMSFRNSDDKLILNTSTGSGTAAVSTAAVVANTWYWIDLRLTMSGTAWQADWAIDTVAQTQFNHTAPTTDTSSAVDLGTRTAGATLTARYDDLVVSKTTGDYPLGKHDVVLLTADTGGTTAEIGTANATSRMVTNSALDATHNSAQILTALTEGPPPTFGGTASGVGQRTSATSNAVGIPMTSYTLGAGEVFSGLRIELPGWAATTTAASWELRSFNGTTETVLHALADPNFDADTAAPAWICKMATAAQFDTQAEVNALVVRMGYSNDVNPAIGVHAVYAEVAVKEATDTPISLSDTAAGDDALAVVKVDENQYRTPPFPPFKAPGMYPVAVPFQLSGDRAALAASSISLDDTAAAADAAVVAAAVPLADTATATDALAVAAAAPLADTAAASDALVVAAAVPLTDTASTVEDLTAGVPISFADTATATDSLSISVTVTLTDTAAATDAITSIAVPITLTDTASASDALLIPPPSLADLTLWFRGDDVSGLSDGAGVSSWTSLAGTSVASQATGGFQPTKQTVSGETVVRFDGTDDRLLMSGDALTAFQNASGATVFIRVKSTASGIFLAFSNGLSSGSARLLMRRLSGLWNVGGRRLDADSIQSVGYQAVTASPEVATAIIDWSTANIDVYVDGIPRGSSSTFQTAGSTSNTASVAAAIGSAASEDTFATADIYEIIIYDRVLAPYERRLIEQYLGVSSAVIGLDDDAVAAESLTSTAAVPLADTATATDALTLPQNEPDAYQAPLPIAGMFVDPGAASIQLKGSTAPSLSQSITLSDDAAATDDLSSNATVPLAETATAADALAVTVALALADTAAAVDALTAGVPITLTDTATALDSLTLTVALALADTATATDAISIPEAAVANVLSRVTTGRQGTRVTVGDEHFRVASGSEHLRAVSGVEHFRVSTGHQTSRIN